MAKRVTPAQLDLQAATMSSIYEQLENDLFSLIIDQLTSADLSKVDQNTMLQWRLDRLYDMKALNQQTIAKVSAATHIAFPQLYNIVFSNGRAVLNQVDKSLSDNHKRITPDKERDNITNKIMNGLMDQAKSGITNYVNQSLVTTNKGTGEVARIYQSILDDATADAISGTLSPQQAVDKAVYKCISQGMRSGLVRSDGAVVGIEGYVRQVVTSTAFSTFNQITQTAANSWGVHTFLMSSHMAARPACSHIQGKVVLNIPSEQASKEEAKYPSIFNFGYGTAAGTLGANCRHSLTEFDPEVNTNTLDPPSPAEAEKNNEITQKQRAMERSVRKYKKLQEAAKQLNDDQSVDKYQQLIKAGQSRIKALVNQNSFLYRDYSREKIYTS